MHDKKSKLLPLVLRAVDLADELRMIVSEINHELVGAHLPVSARAQSSPTTKKQPEIAPFERTLSADQIRVRLRKVQREHGDELTDFETEFVESNLAGLWEFSDKQYLTCERIFKKYKIPLVADDELDQPVDMSDLPF